MEPQELEKKIIHLMLRDSLLIPECPLQAQDFMFFKKEFEEILEIAAKDEPVGFASPFSFSVLKFILPENVEWVSALYFPQYCRELRHARLLREIKDSGDLDKISQILPHQFTIKKAKNIGDLTSEFYDYYAERLEKKEKGYLGVKTNFDFLDQEVIIEETHIITIAARPGVGKSLFSFTLARNIARSGKKVLFLALEMSESEMMERLISTSERVLLSEVRKANIQNIGEVLDRIKTENTNLSILNPISITTPEVLCLARAFDVLFIDQLSNLQDPDVKGENLVMKYKRVYNQLRAIANAKKPVFVCHQINREGTDRPKLHHLKDSGACEEQSNIVIILDYNEDHPDKLYVNAEKNRQGKHAVGKLFNLDAKTATVTEDLSTKPYSLSKSIF